MLAANILNAMSGLPILVGLGVDSLSMSSFNLPKIKYLIRHLSLEKARTCVEEMLRLPDEQSVRVRALGRQ